MSGISKTGLENSYDGFFERVYKMTGQNFSDAYRLFHDPEKQEAAKKAWAARDLEKLWAIFKSEGKDLDAVIEDAINDYL